MAETDALQGVRVIDFGQYIAGPMTAMLLGDFGAEVIRVDPPGGPRHRTPANATWNRGKRSIVLDLKAPGDLAIAHRLIESADVLVENFRPGVMQRLGLGADAMAKLNPRLVYCSLPGFASDDPRAGMRGWEGVIATATACHSSHAAVNISDRPVYTAIPYSSTFATALAATAVGAALIERRRSGLGQHLEIPLYNATFHACSGKLMRVEGAKEVDRASRWTHVQCKDGIWFMYLTGRLQKFFLQLAGKDEATLSPEETRKAIEEVFRTRTATEWEDYCAELGFEGIACLTGQQWLHHPLAEETGTVADFDDPELGRFRGFTVNPRLADTPGRVRGPRPRLDADRKTILAELEKMSAQPRSTPPAPQGGAWPAALHGVKVLDLGIILASPSCGRTLAEFGANVIKIDSAHRNPVNWHNDVNRAKRSIVLDLKQPEGLEIFWRLVADADVLLENFRLGVADKLGIGYQAVSARNPRIIYASVNAYGRPGHYSGRPGREVLAQGIAGMQMRLGGHMPALNPFNGNDYGTGLMCAYGITLALLARERTGRGQFIHSALIYGATQLQTNLLQDFPGKDWTEPSGLDCLGTGPLYRAYAGQDGGWVFMAAQDCGIAGCAALADLAPLQGAALERALEARFATRPADEWVALLAQAGIAAQRSVLKLSHLIDDPLARAQRLVLTREHDDLGMVSTAGPAAKLSRTPVDPGCPAPRPGRDAASILGEIGMAGDLERLVRERIVVTEGIEPGGAS